MFETRAILKVTGWALSATALLLAVLFVVAGERLLCVRSRLDGLQVDAVVVLAGGMAEDKRRIREALDVFAKTGSRYIILPLRHEAFRWSWAVDHYHLQNSIAPKQVLIGRALQEDRDVYKEYGGTYTEAFKTAELMHRYGLNSAIIVTSSYHMRRSRIAFEHFGKIDHLEFFYHPVERNDGGKTLWWMDRYYLAKVIREYRKLVAAYIVYP